MRKVKFLLVAFLLGMAANVSAQSDGWMGVKLSYNPVTIYSETDGEDLEYDQKSNLTGFTLGFVKGFCLIQDMPIYLETGADFTFASKKKKSTGNYYDDKENENVKYKAKTKYSALSLSIPVNIGYKYDFNESLSIYPFVGVTARVNLVGRTKQKGYDADGDRDVDTKSFFNADDMGGYENMWRRFQIGWQIGAKLNVKQFSVAASYGMDFNEVAEGKKVSIPSISVGYNF